MLDKGGSEPAVSRAEEDSPEKHGSPVGQENTRKKRVKPEESEAGLLEAGGVVWPVETEILPINVSPTADIDFLRKENEKSMKFT